MTRPTNVPNQKVRVPISNLTKQQWLQLDDDAKALEIVWVKAGSNRAKYAEEQGRALNPKAAHDCLNKYLDKWKEEAPSCFLRPEFGGPTQKTNHTHTGDKTRPTPDRQVRLRERTPPTRKTPPTPTRGRPSHSSPRIHDRLGPKVRDQHDDKRIPSPWTISKTFQTLDHKTK